MLARTCARLLPAHSVVRVGHARTLLCVRVRKRACVRVRVRGLKESKTSTFTAVNHQPIN